MGVAVGVAKRHATDLSPCQLNLWVLLLLSFSAIFLFTFIFPDTATIPVWLRLLCRLINCCLCYAAFLYFWTASQCVTPTDPLRLRLLYKVVIVELCFCYFFSAAKLIAEAFLEPDAVTAGPVLLGVFIGLNLIFCRAFLSPSIYLSACRTICYLSICLQGCPPPASRLSRPPRRRRRLWSLWQSGSRHLLQREHRHLLNIRRRRLPSEETAAHRCPCTSISSQFSTCSTTTVPGGERGDI